MSATVYVLSLLPTIRCRMSKCILIQSIRYRLTRSDVHDTTRSLKGMSQALGLPKIHLLIDESRGQAQQNAHGINNCLTAFSSSEHNVILVVPNSCSPAEVAVDKSTGNGRVDDARLEDAQIGCYTISLGLSLLKISR